MRISIPFLKSDSNYTLVVPIEDQQIQFDVHWNSRDQAFYVDMYESDDSIIILNMKVLLGISLGRTSPHRFFQRYALTAIDSSNQSRDAGFDDLGQRVELIVQSLE